MGILERLRGLFGGSEGVHDDDPAPTSSMVPGSAAAGVWEPRGEGSELAPDAPPHGGPAPGEDFLKPDVP
jgi:hypothetical protein